jgi:hypothetical protein
MPPRGVVACFDATGQGVAISSPDATASLGPRDVYRFRAWLVVGDEREIAAAIDALRKSHPDEGPQAGGDD